MAIEDGVTLSTLFSREVQAGEDVSDRLKLYQEIRRPRVSRVREASLDTAKGLDNQEFMHDYMTFLSSHNAVEHATQALSKYLDDKVEGKGWDSQNPSFRE